MAKQVNKDIPATKEIRYDFIDIFFLFSFGMSVNLTCLFFWCVNKNGPETAKAVLALLALGCQA